jgi:hypothetical protein
MSELQEDLRSTAETMSAEAERLRDIEELKVTLEPDDPRLLALAEEAERIADRLSAMAGIEKELASEVVEGTAA